MESVRQAVRTLVATETDEVLRDEGVEVRQGWARLRRPGELKVDGWGGGAEHGPQLQHGQRGRRFASTDGCARLGPAVGLGLLIGGWYVGITALTLLLAYLGRGLRRSSGWLVIAAYVLFVVRVLASA